MEEKPEWTVENFAFVSCAEVKEEPKECDDREVSTFEEISIAECDVHIKEELDETAAPAATPALERDPLKVEGEDEVVAAGWSAPDSDRLAQATSMGHTVSSDGAQLEGTLCDELEEDATDDTQVVSSGRSSQGLGHQKNHPSCSRPSRHEYGGECHSFACSGCTQTFSTKFALTMHIFSHMNGVEPPVHVCRLCGEVFHTANSLHSHTSIHCSRDETGRGQDKMSIESDDVSFVLTERGVSQTEACNSGISSDAIGQSISAQGLLPAPERTKTGSSRYVCNICNISFRSPHRFERHVNEHSVSGPYKCDDCGRSFKTSVHLKQHAVSHTRKKSYPCGECGRSFKQPFQLKQHALSHTGERPHVCACGRSFALLSSLKRHAVLHTGEKPYTCDVCFKSFNNAYLLRRHVVIHTGERSYACDECGRSFKQLDHLKQHALCHTREKPHVCACGKSFTQLGSLKRHALIHTGEKPYSCDVCLKSFTNACVLKRHVAVHTGERPYDCADCDKSFKEVGHLKQHLVLHSGSRPHVCRDCGKSFTQSGSLNRHIAKHESRRAVVGT